MGKFINLSNIRKLKQFQNINILDIRYVEGHSKEFWEIIRDLSIKNIDASHTRELNDDILLDNIPYSLEELNISYTNINGDFLKSIKPVHLLKFINI